MRQNSSTNYYNSANLSFVGRPTCFECFRPYTHCVCGLIEPFTAHFNTIILQHPQERKKYYSTVKLLSKAIENLQILRGLDFDASSFEPSSSKQTTYLLYPNPNAIDCTDVPLDSKSNVILIDGTWREARKIIFHNSFLKDLPCLTFKNEISSNYRIRKQPKVGYLSTLESLAYLLKINAKVSGAEKFVSSYDSLLKGFYLMVEQQLNYWPTRIPKLATESSH